MIKKFYANLINSINGLKVAFTEHSFISEIILGFFLILYIIFVELNLLFKLVITLTYFLLLAFEILNTAIEKLCNKITKNYDMDIKKIKDLASASVFLILIILIIEVFYSLLIKIELFYLVTLISKHCDPFLYVSFITIQKRLKSLFNY